MNTIKCPNCGKVFSIDESTYDSLLKSVRNDEFNKEISHREQEYKKDKETSLELLKNELEQKSSSLIHDKELEISKLKDELDSKDKLLKNELETTYKDTINKKDLYIKELESKLELNKKENELSINKAISDKDNEIAKLKNELETNKSVYLENEKTIKDSYEDKLKDKDEQISYYRDLKAKDSTKMIGEDLERHCSDQYNIILRPVFKNAYFDKDNDIKTGSKGDFIFRDYDDEHNEIVSIMFEMKNQNDTTSSKHKNEDFFKELDKDRKEKNCEYAVLVSLLETDSDLYNSGIVDVSYKYPKMYVIRPQFFIPIITLIRNLSLNSLKYKKELELMKEQNIDITHFEENIEEFKTNFSRNYNLAATKFNKAIEEIDKTIANLQKVKDDLVSSSRNLRLANDKADDLSIKKLTKNNPTMKEMFDSLHDKNETH